MLWLYLFLIVFFNGFEAGGYQASLYSIGQVYDLSITSMGLFARHAKRILITSIIAISVITWLITLMDSDSAVMALIIPLGFACGAIYPSVLTTLIGFSGNTGFLAERIGLKGSMLALAAFFILSLISVLALRKETKD